MNSVDRVKELCKTKKVAISRLEKDLGFGNGYISQLKKGTFPSDRLIAISNYLNVSPEYIVGETKEKTAPINGGGIGPNMQKLLEEIKPLNEDQSLELLNIIKGIKRMKKADD